MRVHIFKLTRLAPALLAAALTAASSQGAAAFDPLTPYTGPSVRGVDISTLTDKVMTGYQGWFNCEGDGAGLGWTHWARNRGKLFGPGNVTVDLWPDVSDYATGGDNDEF
jgi:hypothetical protein